MMPHEAHLAARLDWKLGSMIRRTEQTWAGLSLSNRRAYVDLFILLRDALTSVSRGVPPQITCPWSREEISASMVYPWAGYHSSVDALSVDQSPLMVAVRMTERQLRKTGKLPATLNCKRAPVTGLANVAHAYTVEEVAVKRPALPMRLSTSAQANSAAHSH
jgi:hypothetical protein